MTYTNDMRHAVRALQNPTPLPIDVAQKNDTINLLVNRHGLQSLTKPQLADFRAYMHDVIRVIELGGGRVEVIVVE